MDGSERPEQITVAFQLRGVEVPTAQENGTSQLQDRELLDRATFRRRILFRWDKDLLREAPRRHQTGQPLAEGRLTGCSQCVAAQENCQWQLPHPLRRSSYCRPSVLKPIT
jgi:hypothetical protein